MGGQHNGSLIIGITPPPTPDEVEAQKMIADVATQIASDVSHIIGSLRAVVGMGMPPPAAVSMHIGQKSAGRFKGAIIAAIEGDRAKQHVALMRIALQAQDLAEEANSNCSECGGEGDWAHCAPCSLLFGKAIDMRHRALELVR